MNENSTAVIEYDPNVPYPVANIIISSYAHPIIFALSLGSIFWGGICALIVSRTKVEAKNVRVNQDETDRNDPEKDHLPWTPEDCTKEMLLVNKFISEGADTFLKKEYTFLSIFCVIFAILILVAVD